MSQETELPRPEALGRRKRDGEVDEGKGEPVVKARFRGQGEAHLVLLPLLRGADLDVRGEHGIGRGKGRRKKQGRRWTEPEKSRGQSDQGQNGQGHGDAEEAPGHDPALPARSGGRA